MASMLPSVKWWINAVDDNAAYDKLRTPDGRIWTRLLKCSNLEEAKKEKNKFKSDSLYDDAQILDLRNVIWIYVIKSKKKDKMDGGGQANGMVSFKDELQEKIQEVFPKSLVVVKAYKGLGEPSLTVYFTLGKDNSEYQNKIVQNDAMHTIIHIYGVDELGNPKDKLKVESNRHSLSVVSSNKMYAFETVKTGWRNFSGDRNQVVKKLVDYFKKSKVVLLENRDRLDSFTKELVASKYSHGGSVKSKSDISWVITGTHI